MNCYTYVMIIEASAKKHAKLGTDKSRNEYENDAWNYDT